MLSFVEIIIASLGLAGYSNGNDLLTIIGLVGIIICDCIDIFILKHNSATISIAILLAIGASIANHNILYNFNLFLCGENVLMSILTVFIITYSFFKNGKQAQEDNNIQFNKAEEYKEQEKQYKIEEAKLQMLIDKLENKN